MQHRNLDFRIPLTREQWAQLGESADLRPDYGVMRWAPAEFDVIHLSIRDDDAPEGWADLVKPDIGIRPYDREVARFVYNDGRPYAELAPPVQPAPPAVRPEEEQRLEQSLERWVSAKWHELLDLSGITADRGALPATEPNPPE